MTTARDLEVIPGTLDLLILRALTWGPMHGLAVLRWIETGSRRRLRIEEGALYPALHRMEHKEWLESDWGYTDEGRRARYYRLTTAGRRQFASEQSRWQRYAEVVAMLLEPETAP
ncbi:MAG TPA: PadR family transcriptional regulator [Gemmatimonadaceae bacterium]